MPAFREMYRVLRQLPKTFDEDAGRDEFDSPLPLCARRGEAPQLGRSYRSPALAPESTEIGMALIAGKLVRRFVVMLPSPVIVQPCRFADLGGPLHSGCAHQLGPASADGFVGIADLRFLGSARGMNHVRVR